MRRRIFLAVLAVIVAVAAVRLAVVASTTEIGWPTIAVQWKHALYGWTGLGRTPVGSWEPLRQADFWLAEADRLTAEYPDSTAIHMGAAWMLDSPGFGFLQTRYTIRESPYAFSTSSIVFDEATIAKESAEFRAGALARCLALAERATELEPDDVRWWRLRALLLFEGDTFFGDAEFGPRAANWLEVLDECARHDPENALYDYLAANALWEQSAIREWPIDPEWPEDQWRLTITDPEMFALGEQRFLEGQAKRYLAIGEDGFPAVAKFLARSGVPKFDQVESAWNRLLVYRHSMLVLSLGRWQQARADRLRQAGKPEDTAEVLRQTRRFYDQFIAPRETPALTAIASLGHLCSYANTSLINLAEEHPGVVPVASLESIRTQDTKLSATRDQLRSALEQIDADRQRASQETMIPNLFASVAAIATVILVTASAVSLALSRFATAKPLESGSLGEWRQAMVWIAVFAATFTLFGLAPGGVISHSEQSTIATVALWVLAFGVLSAAVCQVFALLRRTTRRLHWLTRLTVVSTAAVVAMLGPLVVVDILRLADYRIEVWLDARAPGGIDPEMLRTGIEAERGSIRWTTVQWFIHHGPLVAVGVCLLIAGLWFMWRCSRSARHGIVDYWTHDVKSRWPMLLRAAGCWTAGAACGCLIVYLIVAPAVIRPTEQLFQYKMQYCRNPDAHYQEIIDEMRSIAATTGTAAEDGEFNFAEAKPKRAEP